MFRSATLAFTATTTLLAVSACGATSDADAVRHAMDGWWTAVADNRADDACGYLSAAGRKNFAEANSHLGRSGCAPLVHTAHALLTAELRAALPGMKVRRITFADHGTKAVIQDTDVTAPEGFDVHPDGRPIVLRRIHGAWKIEDLG